jgi:sugar lactone lactonase YvrE
VAGSLIDQQPRRDSAQIVGDLGSDGQIELAVDVACALGESPVWDWRTCELFWVDIRSGSIYRWSPETDVMERTEVGHSVSALAPRRQGGFVLATRTGFATLDESGAFEMIAEVEVDRVGSRMNDGKCDPYGRFWAGTLSEDHAPEQGSLYCLELDGSVAKVLSAVTVSNGLGWSPDGTTMYYVDSRAYGLDAFDFSVDEGLLRNRRRIVEVPPELGLADGLTVDEEGYVWLCLHSGGAIHRYAPDGTIDMKLDLPVSVVTSCTFGGEDFSDLYITTGIRKDKDEPMAGGVFRYRSTVRGMACHLYGN